MRLLSQRTVDSRHFLVSAPPNPNPAPRAAYCAEVKFKEISAAYQRLITDEQDEEENDYSMGGAGFGAAFDEYEIFQMFMAQMMAGMGSGGGGGSRFGSRGGGGGIEFMFRGGFPGSFGGGASFFSAGGARRGFHPRKKKVKKVGKPPASEQQPDRDEFFEFVWDDFGLSEDDEDEDDGDDDEDDDDFRGGLGAQSAGARARSERVVREAMDEARRNLDVGAKKKSHKKDGKKKKSK